MPPPCPNSRASCQRPGMNENPTMRSNHVVAFVCLYDVTHTLLKPAQVFGRRINGWRETLRLRAAAAATNNSMMNSWWCQACCASSPCHAISSNTVKASSVDVVKLKTTIQQLLQLVMTRYNEDLICIPTPLTIAIAALSSARRSVSTWDPLEYCRTCMNMSLKGDFTLQSCEHSGNTNRHQKPRLIWSACTTCQQKCGRLPLFGHLAAPLEARNFCACHLWTLRSGWKEPEKQKLSKTFTKNIKECERMM